jgi:hypothetical protein
MPYGRGQMGERRLIEEGNCATVDEVYARLGAAKRVRYVWYAGDRDFPPDARAAAVGSSLPRKID